MYAEILLEDLKLLSECDAIFMLDGWKDSPGARTEHAFAVALGLVVQYERDYGYDRIFGDQEGSE